MGYKSYLSEITKKIFFVCQMDTFCLVIPPLQKKIYVYIYMQPYVLDML